MADNLIIETVSIIVGIAGFIFGLTKNEENKKLKRQEIIFPLMDKFDKSKNLKTAKLILDNFILDPNDPKFPERKDWARKEFDKVHGGYYRKRNLKFILRVPRDNDKIEDQGEQDIRNSFDSLLDFLGRLGYLMHIKIITEKEMIYFQYYIDRIRNDDAIIFYIKEYEFELFALLLFKLKKHDERLNDLIERYRLENDYPTIVE